VLLENEPTFTHTNSEVKIVPKVVNIVMAKRPFVKQSKYYTCILLLKRYLNQIHEVASLFYKILRCENRFNTKGFHEQKPISYANKSALIFV